MKYSLFLIFLLIIQFGGASEMIAQQRLLVVDLKDEVSISNVLIFNESQTFVEQTLEDGFVDFPVFQENEIFVFQHQSFVKRTLLYKEIEALNFKILLEKRNVELPTVEVLIPATIYDRKENISKRIEEIDQRQIEVIAPQNSADLLESNSGVYVQRSQAGGGSPVIRGVEANKLLILVDDVRMNNAIYRGGHLQNILTIDPLALQSVSLIYGPGSVLYGSDALGGVMLFRTKNPTFSNQKKWKAKGVLSSKFSSANRGQSYHGNISVGNQKVAAIAGLSVNRFGDLRIGKKSTKDFPDWGYQKEHVETENSLDTIIQNKEVHRIHDTNYQQLDYFGKVAFQLNPKEVLYVNVQGSISSKIHRNDRLNDYQDGALKWAEWHYGPQKRGLYSLSLKSWKNNKFADYISATIAFQQIEESRIKRRYQRGWRTHQIEKVEVWSSNFSANKKLNKNNFYYGIESNYNFVQSTAYENNIFSNETNADILTRYPSGDNFTFSAAAYGKWRRRLTTNWAVNFGLRGTYLSLEANYQPNDLINLPFDKIAYKKAAFNYTGGLVWTKNSNMFSTTLSSGFRAPNLDDVSKIFSPQNGIVVLPNPDVKPEYTYNFDMQYSSKSDIVEWSVDAFTSLYNNLIRRQKTPFEDQDSILFEGDLNEIYTNTNAEEAIIFGGSVNVDFKITSKLNLTSQISYTRGRDLSNDAPLGHIPPVYGRTEITFKPIKDLILTGNLSYNAKKSIDEYSPFREDKDEEATEIGTPAYALLNARINYVFKDNLRLHLSIDNILDQHYRKFASGISGQGRGFGFGLSVHFE